VFEAFYSPIRGKWIACFDYKRFRVVATVAEQMGQEEEILTTKGTKDTKKRKRRKEEKDYSKEIYMESRV
jgi:hypothetical protein